MDSEIRKIKKRRSYKCFRKLAEWLGKKPDASAVLLKIHAIVDDYRGFKSQRNSDCALESIQLVIEEMKTVAEGTQTCGCGNPIRGYEHGDLEDDGICRECR